jgi:hypothetical protein
MWPQGEIIRSTTPGLSRCAQHTQLSRSRHDVYTVSEMCVWCLNLPAQSSRQQHHRRRQTNEGREKQQITAAKGETQKIYGDYRNQLAEL